MKTDLTIDAGDLFEEISRYLEAVDLFRSLDSGPTWRPEVDDPAFTLERFLSDRREHRVVH